MPRDRKLSSTIINAAIFILLEVAALVMLSHKGALQQIWLSRMSHRVMAKAWGGSENIRYYFSLKETNKDLAEDNFNLRRVLEGYQLAERDSVAIARSMEIVQGREYNYTPATIIKISRNKAHNYFIIDKGSEDGIRPQSGVITACGVVGIIDAVDNHYSYGLSLLNSDISVSSRIGHEGASGRMSWDGRSRDRAILQDIPLQYRFSPGDTVWTSGFSAIFPPDIPLGILGESRMVGGAVNEIEVKLLQDFSSLRYVTVVDNQAREEITYLENLEAPEEK